MRNKIKKFPLPNQLGKLMKEIHDIIDEDEFILYGSTPLDLLLNNITEVHDLDIAIKDINNYKIERCREKIKRKGFKIIEPYREYFIYINHKVILIYAKNDKWFLDIGFLDDFEMIGQFDAETLYCRYPELDYVDNFDAITAIREKTLKPVRGLEKENPYMLTARFLYLCAKYNMSLINNPYHKIVILEIKNRIKKWIPFNQFHGPIAHASCISSIFKSILKTRDKINFIKELDEINILEMIFPELQKAIKRLIPSSNQVYQILSEIKTKFELSIFLNQFLEGKDRESFKNHVMLLKIRMWDEQDIKCANFFAKN